MKNPSHVKNPFVKNPFVKNPFVKNPSRSFLAPSPVREGQ